MPNSTKIRTVSYRRAHWNNTQQFPHDLQTYLNSALQNCSTTVSRTFSYADYHIQGISTKADFIRSRNGNQKSVLLMQLVKYEPNGQANTVNKPSTNQQGSVGTENPPAQKDWIDGDVFVLICGNHLLTCASNIRDSSASKFIISLLNQSGNGVGSCVNFDRVGAADKLQLLHREGVKSIELGAGLYETTLDWFQSDVKKNILRKLSDAITDCFADDDELRQVAANENINAKVVLNFDSRKKGGELGIERMQQLGANLIRDEENTDYVIVTRENKRITLDEIQLKKNIHVLKHGKTVDKTDAWDKLKLYFEELDRDGLLNQ
ncbi:MULTISPECIES: hypothetical protein [Pectobacterium]|uniref:hypothetical protein n=1 Tax=Pectobacterium TaxID=122277 RepID=UPI00196901B1|nr:hypothetical protein [Pectobacterium brasiliense]MBN3145347.1 hypothetical protein [Pectobacterium brasiliense]